LQKKKKKKMRKISGALNWGGAGGLLPGGDETSLREGEKRKGLVYSKKEKEKSGKKHSLGGHEIQREKGRNSESPDKRWERGGGRDALHCAEGKIPEGGFAEHSCPALRREKKTTFHGELEGRICKESGKGRGEERLGKHCPEGASQGKRPPVQKGRERGGKGCQGCQQYGPGKGGGRGGKKMFFSARQRKQRFKETMSEEKKKGEQGGGSATGWGEENALIKGRRQKKAQGDAANREVRKRPATKGAEESREGPFGLGGTKKIREGETEKKQKDAAPNGDKGHGATKRQGNRNRKGGGEAFLY